MVDRSSSKVVRALARGVSLVMLLPLLAATAGGEARAEEDPPPTTSISGTVTGASNEPLSTVDVVPYLWDESTGTYDTVGGDAGTDSEGRFTITNIPPGTYTLHFNPEDGIHAEQWWDGKPDQEHADSFEVAAGSQIEDMDARLRLLTPPEGSISGRVANQDGQPLAGATITAFEYIEYEDDDGWTDAWEERGSASTTADGSYTISELAAGEYYLKAEFPPYLTTWWPNRREDWQASPVDLQGQTTVTGIDFQLEPGGTITGRVTAAAAPLEGAEVSALLWDEECGCFDSINSGYTDDSGDYAIGELPSGMYTLRFEAPSESGFVDEWWNDKPYEEVADTFPLGSGGSVSSKDADLALGATITGTVTGADGSPVSEVDVVPYLWDEAAGAYRTVGGDAGPDEDGRFTITGVPEGWYTVQFNAYDDYHATEWWNDQPHQALADRFEARAGSPVEGIDAQLAAGASISGTVTGWDGRPLPGVDVEAYLILPSGPSEDSSAWGSTDENGRYTVTPLPAGTYTLRFWPSDEIHASKWWSSGDAVLDKGTIMSGTVTDSAGNPISGALICLHWRPTGDGGCGATSGADGRYMWPGALEPDTYDLAVWIGGFDTGTRYEVGEVTIEADVEQLTRDITVDLGVERRMTTQRVAGPMATASLPQGEGIAVLEAQAVTGKDIQLGLAEDEPTISGPKPTISGRAVVGGVLTASAGEWTPSEVALSYQWYRNGQPIAGATGSTYRVQLADVGKALTVEVTGSDGNESVSAVSEATSKVPKAKKLTATPTPKISGTAKVGKTLTAKVGTWKPKTVTLAYQWYRSGKAIPGATKRTYKLTPADKGTRVTAKVTGSKVGYAPKTKTSKATRKVAAGTLTSVKPKISGTRQVGRTLTVKTGTWKPSPVTLTYQWYRGTKKIKGATAPSYTLTAADKGKTIKVKVTGSAPGYKTASRKSSATKAIVAGTLTPATPTIAGVPVTRSTLTAEPGVWLPPGVTFAYQWYVAGKAVKGATRSSYETALTDLGKAVTVKVTGSKSGYRTTSRTSAPVTVESRH